SAAAGPMIGLHPDWQYRSEVKYLRAGTTLVLYTDGLIESRHPAPDLNSDGLLQFAETLPSLTPHRLIDDLLLWRVSQGPLDEDECLALAARRPVGRVAVTVGALPAVFPVNFRLAGTQILFRTASGTKLDAATRRAVVAFEVDDFDPDTQTGWSVLIVGLAP